MKKLADKFGFLLFEDRKLADIGTIIYKKIQDRNIKYGPKNIVKKSD